MNMNKRAAAAAVCGLVLACSLTACGDEKEKRSGQIDIDPEKQVISLCDYDGIPIELAQSYEVTDQMVEDTVFQVLDNLGIGTVPVTDRTLIQEGDYVNVDYTGYLDNEPFEGGSAEGVMLEISDDNGYIPGFTDGLIGAETGSTVESEVTFPDVYENNPDLAGKKTTFQFVIHGIYQAITMDMLTDEMIEENFSEAYGLKTKQELIDYVRSYLEESAASNRYSEIISKTRQYMLDNCEVEIPDDYLEARVREYQKLQEDNLSEGQTLEEYVKTNYQMTLEEAQEEWKDILTEQIQTELIFGLIAQKENIEVEEDEFNDYLQSFLDNQSFGFQENADTFRYFGAGNEEEGEAYLRKLYQSNKAASYVADHAEVTEKET